MNRWLVHNEAPSPNWDERALPITMVVLHYTGMRSAEEALERLTDPKAKVSAHYMIDEAGVVGQITRVFAFVSEITLITDKNQTVPVQVARNGLRSVVFGLGNGQLELRFMPANADVQNGDVLVTSGLDGVFLAGFPVAKVVRIERDASYSFARIYCVPIASVESFGQVMVLDPRELRPLPEALSTERSASETRGPKKKRPKAR